MKPYLFQLPEFLSGRPIFSYGVMLGLSFIIGWSLVVWLCRRDGMDGRIPSMAMLVIVVSGLVGARLLHFVSSPTATFTLANFVKFDEGGLVAYGGILSGVLCSWAYVQWRGSDGWVFLDNAAAPVALGLGITRVGCFLFGCDHGLRFQSAWSLRFPRWDDPDVFEWISRSAPAFNDHYEKADPYTSVMWSDHVHPTQLYESLVGFAAFGILLLFRERKRFHGQLMLAFLAFYGVARYVIEVVRGDADRGEGVAGTTFSTSQLIGVLLLASVAYLWWRQRGRGLYAAPGTAAWGSDPAINSTPEPRKAKTRKKRKK